MLLVAVHDVLHPGLDLGGVSAGVVLAERDVDVGAAVVDLGDGGDEELERAKRLVHARHAITGTRDNLQQCRRRKPRRCGPPCRPR